MRKTVIILTLAATAAFAVIALMFAENLDGNPPLMERLLWRTIKTFIHKNGFVESEPGKTTSESQSYALIMALEMDDRETFDRVWAWTNENLRRDDGLFVWIWEDGKITDHHTAPDADQDIAYALILASELWNEPKYLEEAQNILLAFWEKDTRVVAGNRYVTGGDWVSEDSSGTVLNPSYLSPYHYSLFSEYDRERPWESLIPSSFDVLRKCAGPRNLPRDWCKLDTSGSVLSDFEFGEKDPNIYSYDAFRVPFRLAHDYQHSRNPETLELLKSKTEFIRSEWTERRKFSAGYNPDGSPARPEEALAAYGAFLPALAILDREAAGELYQEKIATLDIWISGRSFYDLAWAWFGVHFYRDFR